MIDKPVSTDYLAISKALSAVFPKYTNTILWHEDSRLQELDVSGYYGLQINRLINDLPVTLFLYQKPIDASYVLTDLGSLIFTNDIIEPLAKRGNFGIICVMKIMICLRQIWCGPNASSAYWPVSI